MAPVGDEPSPDASRTVFLAADVVDKAGITFGNIEPKMLSHDISARGQILLLPGKRAVAAVMMVLLRASADHMMADLACPRSTTRIGLRTRAVSARCMGRTAYRAHVR